MTDNITLPREVVEKTLAVLEYGAGPGCECFAGCPECDPANAPSGEEAIQALRAHLAAPKQEPSEDVEALRQDAERWRAYQTAGSELTLRLHNTRSDYRNATIDAAMKADKT